MTTITVDPAALAASLGITTEELLARTGQGDLVTRAAEIVREEGEIAYRELVTRLAEEAPSRFHALDAVLDAEKRKLVKRDRDRYTPREVQR